MQILPSQIDTDWQYPGVFVGDYGQNKAARTIINFCKWRGKGWEPFSYAEINEFNLNNPNRLDQAFSFEELITDGLIIKGDGGYTVTAQFISFYFKFSLLTENLRPAGVVIWANGVRAGQVGQNPDNHLVENRGLWYATIHPAEGGVLSLGSAFLTELEAMVAAFDALAENRSYQEWMDHFRQAVNS